MYHLSCNCSLTFPACRSSDSKDTTLSDVCWHRFFDFYIIPLAKKLKECGVFGVSSDEYLSYAMKNRIEWEQRGQEVVADMMRKIKMAHDARSHSQRVLLAVKSATDVNNNSRSFINASASLRNLATTAESNSNIKYGEDVQKSSSDLI
jgi:hypothetical protein